MCQNVYVFFKNMINLHKSSGKIKAILLFNHFLICRLGSPLREELWMWTILTDAKKSLPSHYSSVLLIHFTEIFIFHYKFSLCLYVSVWYHSFIITYTVRQLYNETEFILTKIEVLSMKQ